MFLIEDFLFFWFHYLYHIPFIYSRIHKVHHEMADTLAYHAFFSHWVEFITNNVLPAYISLFLFKQDLHISSFAAYVSFSILKGHYIHCGYKFPYAPFMPSISETTEIVDASYHNYHHTKNLGNYSGGLAFWENIFKTNTHFRKQEK